MKKLLIGLLSLTSSVSLLAFTYYPDDIEKLTNEIKALGEETIQHRKDEIQGITDCKEFNSKLTNILMGLASDALSISADAIGASEVSRNDEMAKMYRKRMPEHAKQLSERLLEMAEKSTNCRL
ncbi:MAG: hypothetical protein A2381_11405 [Bdellovibrionales bacterium RIFOXYB1_FULL_37_110]|nr:MAG: hypothetical protein A2417_11710 [Bdellovibrionales bacterium RIFOXYC1_FULL_37_79]OFZ57299.1 MAG: hypothetical protein A2381_11405 [Bdellovibrionales bacterium RIFOXYB1_FULL_37_110]OFZ62195.1 MAG: hypothetical protein A2577_13955 [Bdellovibrionales bacterium RIFOXYD1_FULL_36_51]